MHAPRIYLIAGESSGDAHGAVLMREIARLIPGAQFFGAGGPQMQKVAGGQFMDWTQEAVVGLWDVIVKYDVLGKKYQVVRVVNKKAESLGEFPGADEAENAAEGPYHPAIALPQKGQRGYYNLLLDVETLSLSDLDEVERWLRGELKPAVSGKQNPGTALGRGVRTLVVRLLGGEKRHYEARTGKFKP